MKAFIHVLRKDVGGLLDLPEGVFACVWEVGMGKGACGAAGGLCEGRFGPFTSPVFSWQKHRTVSVSVRMPSALHSLLGCYTIAQELIQNHTAKLFSG